MRHDPFSHMKNTSFPASCVVPVDPGTVVLAAAVPRDTFEALFPTLLIRPEPKGPVCAFRFPITGAALLYPSVMFLALSVPPVIFLLTLPSDRPSCLAYSQ